MANYTFDTLEASKRLREAGMAEGVAEAVVAVFQHATTGLDLSHLATKADLAELRAATKDDLAELRAATEAGLTDLRTTGKADLDSARADVQTEMSTKDQLEAVRREMATKSDLLALEVRMSERMRLQGWSIMGGMTLLLGLFTVAGKMIG